MQQLGRILRNGESDRAIAGWDVCREDLGENGLREFWRLGSGGERAYQGSGSQEGDTFEKGCELHVCGCNQLFRREPSK